MTIIANLTAVSGSQPTYLTIYPADVSPKPNASDLNVNPGIALPNLVVVGVIELAESVDTWASNPRGGTCDPNPSRSARAWTAPLSPA